MVWDEGTGRLLVEVEDDLRGSDVVRVPRRACVGVLDAFDALPKRSDGEAPTFSYPEEVLVTWLLYQRSMGSFSPFAPYLATFGGAGDSPLPLLLNEQQWEWMKEKGVDMRTEKWRVDQEKEELLVYFKQLEVNLFQLDPISFPPDSFTFEDYLWAYASVVSRAFVCGAYSKEKSGEEGGRTTRQLELDTCHDGDCADTGEREGYSMKWPSQLICRRGEPLLVPLLDMLPRTRRREDAADVQWGGELGGSIRVRRGGEARGTLMVYTGDMDETDAFHLFGVAERPFEHREDSEVPIFVDLRPKMTWRMFVLPWIRKEAPEYFTKYGKYFQSYRVPSEAQSSGEYMRVARLLTADGNARPGELRQILSDSGRGEAVVLEKEFRALRFLYTSAVALAEELPTAAAALAAAVEDVRGSFSTEPRLAVGSLAIGPGAEEGKSFVTPAVVAALRHRAHQLFEATVLQKRLERMWASLLAA